MYNFTMVGRRVDKEKYVGLIVWIKGTIQEKEQDEEAVKGRLKRSIEKALELSHPSFYWRDVTLSKQETKETLSGINIEDIERWKWYCGWDDPSGFKEFPFTTNEVKKMNDRLLNM